MTPALVLALAMQCAPTIHPDTVLDVMRVESGFNQYAIGIVGQKGLFPSSPGDALAWVQRLQSQGKNYSIGLMQINKSNFSRYGVTPEQLLNPCTNLSVFEKILTDCYRRGSTLKRALSCYYSGNFSTGQKPEKNFSQTSYVQRIGYAPPTGGYVVPSTKSEQHAPTPEKEPAPSVRWPTKIVRGDLISPGAKASQPEIPVYYPAQIVRGAFITPTEETKE
ncbi:TriA protein [Erwinia typographi]|uniref:TriA protein n=1 Tax=Erwinia typographi TaxID=371042 RepID=A0A0A3YNG2_9GAMM|nr:lytic transglycosylase domain-containing protein [Erwinia typographi]KGT87014.1 TriA protein [Erwinia typographi]